MMSAIWRSLIKLLNGMYNTDGRSPPAIVANTLHRYDDSQLLYVWYVSSLLPVSHTY